MGTGTHSTHTDNSHTHVPTGEINEQTLGNDFVAIINSKIAIQYISV